MTPVFLLAGLSAIAGTDDSISTEDLDRHFTEIRRAQNRCGPRAVWYCLRRTGRVVDWQEVLDHSQVGVDGMSLEELQTLVASFGVQAKVVVGEPARLDSLPVPCLVVVGSRHCIVLEGIDKLKGEASFFEPAQGEVITASLAALEAQCSGEAIVFDDTGVSSAAFLGYVVGGTAAVVALWWIVSALILLRRPAGVRSMPSSPVVPAEPAVQ